MMIWSFGQFTKWPIEAFVILKGHSLRLVGKTKNSLFKGRVTGHILKYLSTVFTKTLLKWTLEGALASVSKKPWHPLIFKSWCLQPWILVHYRLAKFHELNKYTGSTGDTLVNLLDGCTIYWESVFRTSTLYW